MLEFGTRMLHLIHQMIQNLPSLLSLGGLKIHANTNTMHVCLQGSFQPGVTGDLNAQVVEVEAR